MTVLRPASDTAMPGPSTIPGARELRPVAQAAWDAEYDRDVWRLRELGIDSRTLARIQFTSIPQPWLKALAKRWARWRLAAGFGPETAASGTRAVARFGEFLAVQESAITSLGQLDRTLLERYLAHLHALLGGRVVHRSTIGQLNLFLTAIRQHGWDDTLPTTAMFFPEDFPKEGQWLPRALSETVMAQLEHPGNLARWGDPAHRLVTLVMMRCGLRISDALRLSPDCITRDGDGAPYLRYFNHKMRREALVPIDDELERELGEQRQRVRDRWPDGTPVLFPQPTNNPDGQRWMVDNTYRRALRRWLERCDVRDEHGQPVRLTRTGSDTRSEPA
jgi:integrase